MGHFYPGDLYSIDDFFTEVASMFDRIQSLLKILLIVYLFIFLEIRSNYLDKILHKT